MDFDESKDFFVASTVGGLFFCVCIATGDIICEGNSLNSTVRYFCLVSFNFCWNDFANSSDHLCSGRWQSGGVGGGVSPPVWLGVVVDREGSLCFMVICCFSLMKVAFVLSLMVRLWFLLLSFRMAPFHLFVFFLWQSGLFIAVIRVWKAVLLLLLWCWHVILARVVYNIVV